MPIRTVTSSTVSRRKFLIGAGALSIACAPRPAQSFPSYATSYGAQARLAGIFGGCGCKCHGDVILRTAWCSRPTGDREVLFAISGMNNVDSARSAIQESLGSQASAFITASPV
jgi:hypothetical protein